MNQDLQQSLADNAKEWLALSLSISSAEKLAFDKIHDGFYATYGAKFMAQVYRATFEQALQSMTEADRDKLLAAFKEAMTQAIDDRYAASQE